MEVVIAGLVIFSMVASYKVRTIGLSTFERRVARWLLADARSWDAKEHAKKSAKKELELVA
jgi:hypothetical protein